NKPLSNVDYCITRADGMEVKGTTDNEGKTKRIKNTQKEMAIEKVEFFASKYTQPLCPQTRIPIGAVLADVALIDVKTTNVNVGSSVKKVTLKGESRPLTSGEIRLSEPVFKDSINYGEVKVYRKELLPFGIQKRENNIMVPWGNLYCTERNFREDYSKENDETKIWFMHEMTHVWQHQLGYDVAMNGLVAAMKLKYKDNSIYEYDPITDKGKLLSNFNFEQQGELISHYFAAKYLWYADYLSSRPFYENILKDFLRNPKNAKLLPDKEASFFKG
ncbi:MAG: hypothetical protein ABFD76_17290, partial [Smithella sp.]